MAEATGPECERLAQGLADNGVSGSDCHNNGVDHGDSLVNGVEDSGSVVDGVDQGGNDSFLFMSYLDEVEDRVEELRRSALSLSQERDSLLTIISQLKDDRLNYRLTRDQSNEMLANIDQLRKRCETVEINIKTPRTTEQETSYLLVNSLVTELEHMCWLGNSDSPLIDQAEGYLNACVSDGSSDGPVDYKFQGMILGCSLTDQKLVRQRLECLVKGNCHADFNEQRLDYLKQLPSSSLEAQEQHQCDQLSNSSLVGTRTASM